MNVSKALLFAVALILIGILIFRLLPGEEQTLGDSCLSLYASVGQSPGENPGESDYETFSSLKIPPLSPDDALDKFIVEDGFRVEVVAHEPMVIDPVAMDIDADGRLWIVNMPSYNMGRTMSVREMLETTGERTPERAQALREQIPDDPEGSIVVLEDTSGDGKMDTYRVFYEGLLLPRSIKVLKDGVLLGEPPNIWFIRDTNGDGRGDTREVISEEFTTPRSMQSGASALFWGMDNWIHNTIHPSIRRAGNQWHTRTLHRLGQWGMTQDDWGRLYSSSNSWPLIAHLIPHGYSHNAEFFNVTAGENVIIAPNEPVWPAHTPATNRGYLVGEVTREDGTLKIAAGTSSTVIYRGHQFGNEYQGNAFTPIGSGNLLKRLIIYEDPAQVEVEARFAYDDREFLASTDERFRPVNIYNAPDGSLYVLDLYRGLYDYILWTTDWLGKYTLENDLDKPTGKFGRIYRIVRDDREIDYNTPKFSRMTPSEVVTYLRHRNGQLRDQAQQVLVQCSPSGIISSLEEMAGDPSEEAWTRLQALWTLDGFNRSVYRQKRLTQTALNALYDEHPRIRAAAVRILEPELAENSASVLARIESMIESEKAPYVRLQMLASLGESEHDSASRLITAILNMDAENSLYLNP